MIVEHSKMNAGTLLRAWNAKGMLIACFHHQSNCHYTTANEITTPYTVLRGFPGGSVVKNLPVMQETWIQSLGQEDPLENWQPIPVLLPRKSHGQRSLVGSSP